MRTTTILTSFGALSTAIAASVQHALFTDQSSLKPSSANRNDGSHPERKFYMPQALDDVVTALSIMQDTYFNLQAGTWPTAIDWTAAVIGTHVSATLSSIVTGLTGPKSGERGASCVGLMGWENIINRHFAHTSIFYYMENAIGLRGQAYDDMLWVVLGWLENVKFAKMYSSKHLVTNRIDGASWHGLQLAPLAAHRARIFYELAETGWDTKACGGGMVWNPRLEPYKNAITNELFAAASIAMYLYFPGDNNTSPFMTADDTPKPHDPTYLDYAVKAYAWLKESNMTNGAGLFQDGYHIRGWKKYNNGTINPGTGDCDSLNTMVYTYNQGVLLGANRGLWLATGLAGYLNDGHELVENVIKATGWPNKNHHWRGLGRAGILEEFCDHTVNCSQDAQTFKGIFFHNLAEFCRPLWSQEEEFLLTGTTQSEEYYVPIYKAHLKRCELYGEWIEHNAEAVLKTKNDAGLFGMWWGVSSRGSSDHEMLTESPQDLPEGAEDWRNPPLDSEYRFTAADLNDRGRGRTVETQSGGLAVLRARWQWQSTFGSRDNDYRS